MSICHSCRVVMSSEETDLWTDHETHLATWLRVASKSANQHALQLTVHSTDTATIHCIISGSGDSLYMLRILAKRGQAQISAIAVKYGITQLMSCPFNLVKRQVFSDFSSTVLWFYVCGLDMLTGLFRGCCVACFMFLCLGLLLFYAVWLT